MTKWQKQLAEKSFDQHELNNFSKIRVTDTTSKNTMSNIAEVEIQYIGYM
jgi:hypothetical protein